jgi:general stress protein 26
MTVQLTHGTENIRRIQKLISGIRIAMLTTMADDGSLHSRPMATQESDFDGHLYFLTAAHSGKSAEIGHQHRVNLAYTDPASNRYISIAGYADITHDAEKTKELWNPTYQTWFPQGPDDAELAVLKVTVESAEYWDAPSGRMVYLIGFVQTITPSHAPHVSTNERLTLQSQ